MTGTETQPDLLIEHNAPIDTWFHIGGRAAHLARPTNEDQLRRCLERDDELLLLGEGANLLVDDDGVSTLVVSIQNDPMGVTHIDQSSGLVRVGAGAALPRLISKTVAAGLAGLETLAGIPATLGGAVVMNAGGKFGSISDHLISVRAMDRAGRTHEFTRADIDFGYRRSGLNHLILLSADFALTPDDPETLRTRLTECMTYKTNSQPMRDKSAGCCFKNPELTSAIEGVGDEGERVSAGMLIDRAGCKGMTSGGATVSDKHANFIVTTEDAKARDVITLMESVKQRVHSELGVTLEREVVVWSERDA